ncbi:7772_t:CDS:2, partial [Racocetra fulgida]
KSLPKQKSSPNFKQERNANGKQERNADGKHERNTKDKHERNTNYVIKNELYAKRNKLKKLQIELSLKIKDDLGYHSKNLTDLRNRLGSNTEGNNDLEKELESTTTPQVGSPPPYYETIDSIETLDRIRYSAHIATINDESKTCDSIDGMKLGNRLEVRNNVSVSIETLDRIRYSAHVVIINDESKTCNNIDGMKLGNRSEVRNNVSEYISVYSTIFQGPSDIAITEAERLFSLLKNQKDKIDNILDSYAVYAVGPKFQNDYSMPYIACWAANPLTVSIMEKISGLFNHEFEFSTTNSDAVEQFEIDLNNCGVTEFLSNQCPSLNKFICYYIDSLEICSSPIPKSDNTCVIIQKKKHSPHKANNNITSTKVHENDYSLSSKAIAIGNKKSRSSTATTKEWTMRDEFSETTGNKWLYRFTDSDVYDTLDNRFSINTDLHKGESVTVTSKNNNQPLKENDDEFIK